MANPNYTYFDKETAVNGELTTSNVVVEGSFEGQIVANGRILLKKTAVVDATLQAEKLMIAEGAVCNGRISLKKDRGEQKG